MRKNQVRIYKKLFGMKLFGMKQDVQVSLIVEKNITIRGSLNEVCEKSPLIFR